MGCLARRRLGRRPGRACRWAFLWPRIRLPGLRRCACAPGRGVLRRGRLYCSCYRLHRLPRPQAKRTSKANRIHPRSVEQFQDVYKRQHFTCPHCQEVIDIFSSGGTERTAAQFGLEFLGSLDLDPAIREGGDRGFPVTLAGPENAGAKPFFEVARKVAARAQEIAASSEQILEIS